jgi:hypothetical protein
MESAGSKIESSDGIKFSTDGKSIILQDNILTGSFVISPQTAQQYFNQGLPSWNGTATSNGSGFKVQMRFPYSTGWSPWLTVGYWKNNIWSDYGTTTYGGGKIEYDWVNLYTYNNSWQFKVILTRTSLSETSPSISKLSFFISDSRTTSNANITQIVADNPAPIFVQTNHVYQYAVDPVIGGDICSPSTVSMILRSYNIPVDVYQFALATRDPYYGMFGIWPRVVQNAFEYGLDGAVTRYRTWSDARKVLAAGGRIGMSIGSPLYTGHLVMLAGFTNDGNPIVHDPAKSNGYSYVFNKNDLSRSWFQKGGVAYTFYPKQLVSVENENDKIIGDDFILHQNYPNPFNGTTIINYQIKSSSYVSLSIYDMLGKEIKVLVNEIKQPGIHSVEFDANDLPSGVYLYRLNSGNFSETKRLVLIK